VDTEGINFSWLEIAITSDQNVPMGASGQSTEQPCYIARMLQIATVTGHVFIWDLQRTRGIMPQPIWDRLVKDH